MAMPRKDGGVFGIVLRFVFKSRQDAKKRCGDTRDGPAGGETEEDDETLAIARNFHEVHDEIARSFFSRGE